MGQFFNSINEVRKNYTKYDGWEQEQADERARKEYLAKALDIPEDKVELTQKRAETVIRATELMDARSEDNCQNMEQVTGMLSIIPTLGITFAQTPVLNWIEKKVNAKTQKEIDKINAELKSLNTINDEYISKSDRIRNLSAQMSKNSNKIRKYGPFGGIVLMLGTAIGMILWSNSKQKEASRIGRYQAKQNELKGLENFVIYTPEQLEKAKEIAKNIPDEKEKNDISKMISELKDRSKDKKAYKEYLSKKDPKEIEKLKALNLSPEQIARGQEDRELIVDAVKEINIKAEEYSENIENSFDTLSTVSWLIAAPLGFGINKVMKALKTGAKARNLVSLAVPILTSLGISLTGTFEEKKASRVGRYKARQDLLKNPARLMAFSDEDMQKAEDIKAPKQKQSFFEKLGDSFAFLKKYYKDKSEYKKYKKTTQKENEKIQKAFKQIETTDAQKAEAKALQKNVFRAFDEIDEMSQRYSEDVEAGCDIGKELGVTAWTLGSMGAMAYLAVSISKGKFPLSKVINKLTNLTFDAKSPIKKSVNELYDILKTKDKATIREFQEKLVKGDLKYFLENPENADLKNAFSKLKNTFVESGIEGIESKISTFEKGKDFNLSNALNEIFKSHLKQTWLAKWTRGILSQSTKLWLKNKASKANVEIPKEVQETLGMNFKYKNYNTLINTGIVAGVPVLGLILGIPYAFNAWLTNIQKKAGKIGIMKAMDKIDDPKIFAPEGVELKNVPSKVDSPESVPSKQEPPEEKMQTGNLLKKFQNR